jgi:hypothetical protein
MVIGNRSLSDENMKWYGFTGPWDRDKITREIENYIVRNVRKVISNKRNGAIAGGAPGSDTIVSKVVEKYGNIDRQLKIYLPNDYGGFLSCLGHWHDQEKSDRRLNYGVMDQMTRHLMRLKTNHKEIIYEGPESETLDDSYYSKRNSRVVRASDVLYAIHVDNTGGVRDTIEKAIGIGIPVFIKRFEVNETDWTEGVDYLEFNVSRRIHSKRTSRVISSWYLERGLRPAQLDRYKYYTQRDIKTTVKD